MMTEETEQELFDRLRNDTELKNIIDELTVAPIDDVFLDIVRGLTSVKYWWILCKGESVKTKQKRRKDLAKKIRAFAQELNNDIDARWFRITSPDSIFITHVEGINSRDGSPVPCPTIAEYLRGAGDVLESMNSGNDKYIQPLQTSRMDLKSFAKREVWFFITNDFKLGKESPNQEISQIVNILLNLSGDEQVKPVDIANMAKPKRI